MLGEENENSKTNLDSADAVEPQQLCNCQKPDAHF